MSACYERISRQLQGFPVNALHFHKGVLISLIITTRISMKSCHPFLASRIATKKHAL